jgi:hypothetical protein
MAVVGDEFAASFDDLSDVLPNIFAFLPPKDIMRSRRVNKKIREGVKKTIVPLSDFGVWRVETYNAMNVMTRAMPNLQQITIGSLGGDGRWSDGEDPDEGLADITANDTTHDIEIISRFSKLQGLGITAPLNGRYPFLFNSFPLLQKLSIKHCPYLKWDLDMLAGFPTLKELVCGHNRCMTGNISSLRVLKDTLEKVHVRFCANVEGNFMDLADFPRLKELDLWGTAVTGDIRDIGCNDFSSLEYLDLPKSVYGGTGYALQRISDGPDLVKAVYLLEKQHPKLFNLEEWYAKLSGDSADWYDDAEGDVVGPPFGIRFVEVGSRLGYRWGAASFSRNPCEVNWLDPEPDTGSSDYGKYIEELEQINGEVNVFRGFHQPPTEEEYRECIFRR